MNNLTYFIGGYFVFWLATAAYLYSIDRRQRHLSLELKKLTEQK